MDLHPATGATRVSSPLRVIPANTADIGRATLGNDLSEARSPSAKVHELDNRGSTFYLTRYWAEALANQGDDARLAERFRPVAEALVANESKILAELDAAQGSPQDLGGYYRPDAQRASAVMRPSGTLNAIIDSI